MVRVLAWDACWNVRDLGGYPTRSGGVTQYGRVIRAGNLSKLTDGGRAAMRAADVRTVIDLRDPREFAIDMNPFHASGRWTGEVSYLNVPLISEANWTAVKDAELRERGYELIVELSAHNVGQVMTAIASAEPGAVVIHCHAGKERTGVVAALLLELADVATEDIAADYIASDEHLQPLYEEWTMREPDPEKRVRVLASYQSDAPQILSVLDYVRQRGGVDACLHAAGVSEGALDALRRRLLEPVSVAR